MRKIIKKIKMKKENIMVVLSGAVFMTVMDVSNVLAAGDASSVTKPLDNLKTLVFAIIGAIGVIILAKNVMEFAQAYQAQDSSTMNSALILGISSQRMVVMIDKLKSLPTDTSEQLIGTFISVIDNLGVLAGGGK